MIQFQVCVLLRLAMTDNSRTCQLKPAVICDVCFQLMKASSDFFPTCLYESILIVTRQVCLRVKSAWIAHSQACQRESHLMVM